MKKTLSATLLAILLFVLAGCGSAAQSVPELNRDFDMGTTATIKVPSKWEQDNVSLTDNSGIVKFSKGDIGSDGYQSFYVDWNDYSAYSAVKPRTFDEELDGIKQSRGKDGAGFRNFEIDQITAIENDAVDGAECRVFEENYDVENSEGKVVRESVTDYVAIIKRGNVTIKVESDNLNLLKELVSTLRIH